MIDAYAHPQTWPLRTRLSVRARKLAPRVRHKTPREFAATLKRKLVGPKTDRAAYINNWLGEVNPNLPLPLKATRIAGDTALIAYTPSAYAGRATFIRAGKTGAVFPPSARNVWRGLIKDLDIQTTRGDHSSILKEHAGELAQRVSGTSFRTPIVIPGEHRAQRARCEGRGPRQFGSHAACFRNSIFQHRSRPSAWVPFPRLSAFGAEARRG